MLMAAARARKALKSHFLVNRWGAETAAPAL